MRLVKKVAKKCVPARYRPALRRLYAGFRSMLPLGSQVLCPCCEQLFDRFLPYGVNPRPNAYCPGCGSLERHRLLWLYLESKTDFFSAPLRVLHFAPEAALSNPFAAMQNLQYVSADVESPLAMRKLDITSIPLADNAVDVIICYHVLEHVPDDRKAMAELYRVLAPGGFAVLQVPLDTGRAETYEDPTVTRPEDRLRLFGQNDHVRIYGRDYKDRLESAGFRVRVDDFVKGFSSRTVRTFGLTEAEDLYVCTKA
jgi:SAM-dependent methyltransferase